MSVTDDKHGTDQGGHNAAQLFQGEWLPQKQGGTEGNGNGVQGDDERGSSGLDMLEAGKEQNIIAEYAGQSEK